MASQGPLFPGTVTTAVGAAGAEDWVTPNNIKVDDGTEAQIIAATFDSPDQSFELTAANFGFTVPTGATIDGLVVEIDRRCFAGSAQDNNVVVVHQFGVSSDKATATAWPATLAVASYGSAADVWGLTATPAMVNDPAFGVTLVALATAVNTDIAVDFIRMTVHYTPAGAAVLTGTAVPSATEAEIAAGGKTLILTLTGTTFIP